MSFFWHRTTLSLSAGKSAARGLVWLGLAAVILAVACQNGPEDASPTATLATTGEQAVGTATGVPGAPAFTPVPAPVLYTVQSGDSISVICQEMLPLLQLRECVSEIVRINELASANEIAVGQELILPGTSPDAAAPPVSPDAEPIALSGVGQFATDPITPPAAISVLSFSHDGSSNFAVFVFVDGEQDLLINEIGAYQGSRPVVSSVPFVLDIDADGAWTVVIEPIGFSSTALFSGRGDAVSGLFNPPAAGAWEISHDGAGNFVVWVHCTGGTDLIQNEIGSVSGSRVIAFEGTPCFWEVEADGEWSLTPR